MIIALLIYMLRAYVKKLLILFARIFNRRIETHILQISWALIWNFKDIFLKISKRKLVLATISMWGCYLASYSLFAGCLTVLGNTTNWTDIFILLFAQNGLTKSFVMTMVSFPDVYADIAFFSVYMFVPLVLLLLIAPLLNRNDKLNFKDEENGYLNLLPHLDFRERLNFLENYFANDNKDYVTNYLKINQGISIVRDFSAGSNATTMLCMDGDKLLFRKYAFGDDGEKLYQQILWIKSNMNRLALPHIIRYEKSDLYCYYDMPYRANTVGLFEYAHSMPVENTWVIIQNTLESLELSIYKKDVKQADKCTIEKYVDSKVEKNINKIKNGKYIQKLLQYDMIYINGIEYKNLNFYEKYLTNDYLQKIFVNDNYAVIHGDLTIENIICTIDKQGKDDFYIIDPNTGNVHESPNLDYGKLLQSIHGGYEFLMSTNNVTISENRVNFLFTKSSAYKELHGKLHSYMMEQFGEERTRSIYFHEIIHWLRLMPYKIDKDDKKSVLFYAGMLMVMNDVIEMYCKD